MRRDVEEDHLLLVVDERRALNCGAERNALVRVNALARLALEELRDRQLDLRHAGHAADEKHFVDIFFPRRASARVWRQMSIVRSIRSDDRSSSVSRSIDR